MNTEHQFKWKLTRPKSIQRLWNQNRNVTGAVTTAENAFLSGVGGEQIFG